MILPGIIAAGGSIPLSAPTITGATGMGGPVSDGGSTTDTVLTMAVSLTGTHAKAGDLLRILDAAVQTGTDYTLLSSDILAGTASNATGTLAVSGTAHTLTAELVHDGTPTSPSNTWTVTVTGATAYSLIQFDDDSTSLTLTNFQPAVQPDNGKYSMFFYGVLPFVYSPSVQYGIGTFTNPNNPSDSGLFLVAIPNASSSELAGTADDFNGGNNSFASIPAQVGVALQGILICFDTSVEPNVAAMYVNGVKQTLNLNDNGVVISAFTGSTFAISANANIAGVQFGTYWVAANTSLMDGSGNIDSGTLAKFFPLDGSTPNPASFPTGDILLYGIDAAGFQTNKGTAGALTPAGSFSVIADPIPPDAIQFVGTAFSFGASDLDITGIIPIQAGDLAVWSQFQQEQNGASDPPVTPVVPTGFTQVIAATDGTDSTNTGIVSYVLAYKILDGTETDITGMTNQGTIETSITVWRGTGTWAAGTPADIISANAGVTAQSVGALSGSYIVIGGVGSYQNQNDMVPSPTPTFALTQPADGSLVTQQQYWWVFQDGGALVTATPANPSTDINCFVCAFTLTP